MDGPLGSGKRVKVRGTTQKGVTQGIDNYDSECVLVLFDGTSEPISVYGQLLDVINEQDDVCGVITTITDERRRGKENPETELLFYKMCANIKNPALYPCQLNRL